MLRSFLALACCAVIAAGAGACSGDDNAADASSDRFGIRPTPEAGGDDAGGDSGGGATATMRLAHLSPDLPPIDFCWRTAGAATYNGPVLGGGGDAGSTDGADDAALDADATLDGDAAPGDATLADADAEAGPDAESDVSGEADAEPDGDADAAGDAAADAGAPVLSFAHLTGDIPFPTSGTFDIALVAAGSTSCDAPLLVQHVTLDAGKRSTVVVMGLLSAEAGAEGALSLAPFVDEATKDPQVARVRVVHAALGATDGSPAAGRLEVLLGATVVAPEVMPRQASAESTMPSIDVLGYASVSPVADPTAVTVIATTDAGAQGTWKTQAVSLGVQPDTLHTAYVVGLAQQQLGVLWCAEAQTSGPLAGCTLLPASR